MTHVSNSQVQEITGLFSDFDIDLMRIMLDANRALVDSGDLAELGVHLGKSAVLIGLSCHTDEVFTVVDLFDDSENADDENCDELTRSYSGLSGDQFEANFPRMHPSLPVVVQGPSENVADTARHGTHRFVHIDASHLFDHVQQDVVAACMLLHDDGVVVFDDFRAACTLGVSAAVWQACAEGMHLIAASTDELYATYGDSEHYRQVVLRWAHGTGAKTEAHFIGEDELLLTCPAPQRRPTAKDFVPPALTPFAKSVLRAAKAHK